MTLLNIKTFIFPVLLALSSFNTSSDSFNEVAQASSELENEELFECVRACQETFVTDRDATFVLMRERIANCIQLEGPQFTLEYCTEHWEEVYERVFVFIEQTYWNCDCDCMIEFNNGVGCQN